MNEVNEISKEFIKVIWDNKTKQSVFYDLTFLKDIREKEKIRAEGIGTAILSRKQNKLLSSPFFLTKYDTLYLFEKNRIKFDNDENEKNALEYFKRIKSKEKYLIFKDLKDKNYYLTSGFKFGADFLAYKDDPIIMHSELIIFVKRFNEEFSLENMIQYERISNVTLKNFVLASVNLEGKCEYLNFSWENFKINK